MTYTIAFDTICNGYQPVTVSQNGINKPMTFDTKAEAESEFNDDPEFYEDCFVIQLSNIGHKSIFNGVK